MKKHIHLTVLQFLILWLQVSYLHPLTDTLSGPEDHDYGEVVQSQFSPTKVDIQQAQDKVLPRELELNAVQQLGVLPSDEQEECYRQQNIDPPLGSFHKDHHPSEEVAIDTSLVPSLYRVNHGQRPFDKAEESNKLNVPDQAVSLYADDKGVFTKKTSNCGNVELCENNHLHETDPQIENELENNVHKSQVSDYSRLHFIEGKRSVDKINRRVYKPIEIESDFPLYDEDLEFSGDPLHGILDDKYWENQQDRSAVIRNYIDLASNNMVPYGVDLVKRNIDSGKCGIDERGERCHCDQIVACKDCKKGRQEDVQEVKSTTNRMKYSPNREKHESSFNDAEVVMDETHSNNGRFSRKLLSLNYEDDYGEEFGDNLSANVTSWRTEGDNEEMEHESFNPKRVVNKIHNRKSSFGYEEEGEYNDKFKQDYISQDENLHSQHKNRRNSQSTTNINDYSNLLKSPKQHDHDKLSLDMPYLEIPRRNPSVYSSDKLANMMQKVHQEKVKYPPKVIGQRVKSHQKFEALGDQIFQKVTLTPSALHNDELKKKMIKGSYFQKGRRSPEDFMPDYLKLPQIGSFLDHTSNVDKLNVSNSTFSNSGPTNPINVTTIGIPTNYTSTTSTTFAFPKKHSDNQHEIAEEVVDAEIANDVVETVLMESQRDAMSGHHLGLYRTNSSVGNYGRVVPETEKVVSQVLHCIMGKMKSHLAKQSCIILDVQLLEFLKWLVLTGEPKRDHTQKESNLAYEPNVPPSMVRTDAPKKVATTCFPVEEADSEATSESQLHYAVDFKSNNSSSPVS